MISHPTTAYRPERVSPPGDSLQDSLEFYGMTQTEFAERTGLSAKTVNQIIAGKAPITETNALAFERTLGTPAHFWLSREAKYREFLARQNESNLGLEHADWARRFPYKKMSDQGWVVPTKNAAEKAQHLLRFFGVSDQDCWRSLWESPQAAFRQMSRSGKNIAVISSWLRQGERLAQKMETPAFDESAFTSALKSLRSATVETSPEVFMKRIEQACSDAGVRYLLVRELPSLGIFGVTRWFGGSPLIQQSLLLKTHDHFWFTFFHEAKHVMQKVKKHIFLEAKELPEADEKREREANRFAGDLLIPSAEYEDFIARECFEKSAILRFARSIDIHPGIVVGRLQRERSIDYTHPARTLKVHFQWPS